MEIEVNYIGVPDSRAFRDCLECLVYNVYVKKNSTLTIKYLSLAYQGLFLNIYIIEICHVTPTNAVLYRVN